MEQYDDVARAYELLIAPKYEPIARQVADRLPPGTNEVVVEPAIGTGLLTRLALPRLPRCREYIGVDVSAGMLDVARGLLPDWVSLVEASAAEMPIEDGFADLLISSLGPVHATDELMGEAVRVVKTGGAIVLGLWGEGYRELDVLQSVRDRLDAGSYPTGVADEVRERAARVGLIDVEMETVRLPVTHDSLDAYLEYRRSFGRDPWLPEGVDDDWEVFMREEASRYLTASGQVDLDWTILVISGRRVDAVEVSVR